MKNPFHKLFFYWFWDQWDFGTEVRWNGGGYLYGAAPYKQWNIGPLKVRKYL